MLHEGAVPPLLAPACCGSGCAEHRPVGPRYPGQGCAVQLCQGEDCSIDYPCFQNLCAACCVPPSSGKGWGGSLGFGFAAVGLCLGCAPCAAHACSVNGSCQSGMLSVCLPTDVKSPVHWASVRASWADSCLEFLICFTALYSTLPIWELAPRFWINL